MWIGKDVGGRAEVRKNYSRDEQRTEVFRRHPDAQPQIGAAPGLP